jgi:hypothetical protein
MSRFKVSLANTGWLLPRALFLVLGLTSIPALRADDPVRETDYQGSHTLVLRVTDRYLALLKVAYGQLDHGFEPGNLEAQLEVRRLYEFHRVLLKPYPVDPFEYLVFGRLEGPQSISKPGDLMATLKPMAVKTAILPRVPARPGPEEEPLDLDQRATQAENAAWLQEIQFSLDRIPGFRARYVHIRDFLHPNSVSRFHFVLKQVAAAPPASSGSASSSASAPAYGYALEDLGGTNGTRVGPTRLNRQQSTHIRLGSPIRFASLTQVARQYLDRIAAAGQEQPVFAGLPALTLKDLRLECELALGTREECLEARARINSRLAPGRAWLLALQPDPPASEADLEQVLAVERARADAAHAGRESKGDATVPAQAPERPEAHPEHELDPEQSEREARRMLAEAGAAAASATSAAEGPPGVPVATLEEALTCSVCSKVIFDPVTLDCGHAFCRTCIASWFQSLGAQKCPRCRAQHPGKPKPAPVLNQAIELWAARLPLARWQAREIQQAECQSAKETGAGPHSPGPGWLLAQGHEIHHHTVDITQARDTVCQAGDCLEMIGVGEARVAEQRVAPLPPGRPRHYHLRCWARMHSADDPRPFLRGREALTASQNEAVNQELARTRLK